MAVQWHHWIDEASLGQLLPPGQEHFARPVVESLGRFLSGLPAAMQADILAAQARLPADACVSARLASLARCCPVLHKLGQVMARDRRLALRLRRELQQLESLPATIPLPEIRRALAAELGDVARLGVRLQPPALAQASVAVVIPFTRRPETIPRDARRSQRHGVFKLLKPGIRERLGRELDALGQVGVFLDQRCDDLRLPHLDYEQTFEQVRDKLQHEVQLDREQRHLAQAATFYRPAPRVHVPQLMEFCTTSVTSMERIFGRPVAELRSAAGGEERELVSLVADALLARPLLAAPGTTMFHGDPHAGNLMWTDERRLALLDWSLVGHFSAAQRQAMARLLLGAMTFRPHVMIEALSGLTVGSQAGGGPGQERLPAVVRDWLEKLRRGAVPGLSWLTGMLDEAVQTAGLRFDADLMLFRKTWHSLEGLLADLHASRDTVDRLLGVALVRQFINEWPRRWMAHPLSRDFATPLSNADLTEAALALPWAVADCWWEQGLDLWRFLGQLLGPPPRSAAAPVTSTCGTSGSRF